MDSPERIFTPIAISEVKIQENEWLDEDDMQGVPSYVFTNQGPLLRKDHRK
jgi:hypothetical protein